MSIRKPTAGAHASETPDEIRAEIAEVRAELGDTVEALAAKADVKQRAKAAADSAKSRVGETVATSARAAQERANTLAGKAKSLDVQRIKTEGPTKARQAAVRVRGMVRQRPAPVAAVVGAVVLVIVAVSRRRSR